MEVEVEGGTEAGRGGEMDIVGSAARREETGPKTYPGCGGKLAGKREVRGVSCEAAKWAGCSKIPRPEGDVGGVSCETSRWAGCSAATCP
jgi:hypothetical protein